MFEIDPSATRDTTVFVITVAPSTAAAAAVAADVLVHLSVT